MKKLKKFTATPRVEDIEPLREYARSADLEEASLKELKIFYRRFLQYWSYYPILDGTVTKQWELSDRRIQLLIQRRSQPNPYVIAVVSALLSFAVTVSGFYLKDRLFNEQSNSVSKSETQDESEQGEVTGT